MDLKLHTSYGSSADVISILDFVERELDGSDYERGQIEALNKMADNIGKSFARLIDTLAAKGLLTGTEIVDIVTGYPQEYSDIELLEGEDEV